MADVPQWNLRLFPRGLAEYATLAGDVAFYAKYPAELADALMRATTGLFEADGEQSSSSDSPFMIALNSPLMNSRRWWRVFHSLQPNCPLDTEVFVRFQLKWLNVLMPDGARCEPDTTQISALSKVIEEVELLGMWLGATGLWENRPPEVEAEQQKKRDCVKSLRRMWNIIQKRGQRTPDGIIDANDRGQRVGLKVLGLLGLYSGYERNRSELNAEAEALIKEYNLTTNDIIGS